MGLTEQRYKDVREKLDKLGYRQPLGFDSMLLVEHLLSDLLHTTDSLKHYKNIAQESLEKCAELQYGVEPYRHDNAKLVQECNELHQQLITERESAEKRQKELKSRIRTLENINTDLEFVCAQHLNRIHQLSTQLAGKTQKVLNLQGIRANPSTAVKKDKKVLISSRSGSSDEKRRFPSSSATQITSQSSSEIYKTYNNTSNICNVSKNQYESLLNELKTLKEENLEYIEEIASIKRKVATRNEEINRLQDLLEGGRPMMAVIGKCVCPCCKAKDCCMRSSVTNAEKQLEEQLKECQELQHEAMCRAVKLAERNRLLEDDLKRLNHCNCTSKYFDGSKNDDKIEKLHNMVETKNKEIEALENKVKDLEKLKNDLEADKSSVDRVLEGVIDERKKLNDRVNRLSIIERDLMAEIDCLNENNEQQRLRIIEIEERLSKAEKLASATRVSLNVPKNGNGGVKKNGNGASAGSLLVGGKSSSVIISGVSSPPPEKQNGKKEVSKPTELKKNSNNNGKNGKSIRKESDKSLEKDKMKVSSITLPPPNSGTEATSSSSLLSNLRTSSTPSPPPEEAKLKRPCKKKLLKELRDSNQSEKESLTEFKDTCKEELRKERENLVKERKKFEETIKELTEKQMELMAKLQQKKESDHSLPDSNEKLQKQKESRFGPQLSEKPQQQRDPRHPSQIIPPANAGVVNTNCTVCQGSFSMGDDGEPHWIKLERIQAERDYYFKEYCRLRDQIACVDETSNEPCGGRMQSLNIKLERLLTEREYYYKEFCKAQECITTLRTENAAVSRSPSNERTIMITGPPDTVDVSFNNCMCSRVCPCSCPCKKC